MKIDINKISSYDIDPKDEVTLITYNKWLKEILYVKNKNTKGRIKLLPGGMYRILLLERLNNVRNKLRIDLKELLL